MRFLRSNPHMTPAAFPSPSASVHPPISLGVSASFSSFPSTQSLEVRFVCLHVSECAHSSIERVLFCACVCVCVCSRVTSPSVSVPPPISLGSFASFSTFPSTMRWELSVCEHVCVYVRACACVRAGLSCFVTVLPIDSVNFEVINSVLLSQGCWCVRYLQLFFSNPIFLLSAQTGW